MPNPNQILALLVFLGFHWPLKIALDFTNVPLTFKLIFTYSNPAIETIEKGAKHVQS